MLKYQIAFPILGPEERKNLLDCIDSGWISSSGKYVGEFESAFAKYCSAKYAVSVSNGTVALMLALLALGLENGDEVIIPNLTFGACANAPVLLGIKPVLVDVEPRTWNISAAEIERNITKKTRAILAVHLYGLPCEMEKIMRVAKKYKLKVIEDAAEAHGAMLGEKKAGSIGDIGCFSFFANKIITTGEGGMCVTNDKKLFERMVLLKNHGMDPGKKYWHEIVGGNFRMTNLQAAIGVAQLKKIEKFIARKIRIASWYKAEIKKQNVPVAFQIEPENSRSVWWMFTVAAKNKINSDSLAAALKAHGIDSRPIFVPLDRMPAFKKLRKSDDLKISHFLGGRGITLPTNLMLTREDIKFIVSKLNIALSKMK